MRIVLGLTILLFAPLVNSEKSDGHPSFVSRSQDMDPLEESEKPGEFEETQPLTSKPIRVEIWKEKRILSIIINEETHDSHPIGLGFNPKGKKTQQGDGATPEGVYRVCVKNPYSQYYLSLGLTYPNETDAKEGRELGLIDRSEESNITQALQSGHCPPWSTVLGGEIFIHGRGSSEDWTLGCIALDDDAMKSLYDSVQVGTEVTILP